MKSPSLEQADAAERHTQARYERDRRDRAVLSARRRRPGRLALAVAFAGLIAMALLVVVITLGTGR